jgi:hypothetical protein
MALRAPILPAPFPIEKFYFDNEVAKIGFVVGRLEWP